MDKKIRLGIIGVGNMGSGHARNVLARICSKILFQEQIYFLLKKRTRANNCWPRSGEQVFCSYKEHRSGF